MCTRKNVPRTTSLARDVLFSVEGTLFPHFLLYYSVTMLHFPQTMNSPPLCDELSLLSGGSDRIGSMTCVNKEGIPTIVSTSEQGHELRNMDAHV
jgi:hypothetical protein